MNPIQKFGYCGPGRTAMRRLKHEVLDRILLRRTKEGRSEDIVLPPKNIVLRKDAFDPFELDYYQSLYSQSQTQFNAYVSSGTLLNNYAHIFDLLIRLRQAVNHPYLVQFSEKNYFQRGRRRRKRTARAPSVMSQRRAVSSQSAVMYFAENACTSTWTQHRAILFDALLVRSRFRSTSALRVMPRRRKWPRASARRRVFLHVSASPLTFGAAPRSRR